MPSINPPKHVSRKHALREDTVVTFYAKAWDYFDKNRTLVYALLGGLVVLVLAIVGYVLYQEQQEDEAVGMLAGAVALYEAGDYRAALDGAGGAPGLLAVADDYGGTDAGNLAHFYTADALYRLGEYDQALEHFRAYDKEENFLGASALAGEAAIYENREDFDRAGDTYRRAALFFESDLTSPQYLLNAGRAYERAGDFDSAREAYELIRERFPDATAAANVDLYLARVEARAQARGDG